MFSLVSSQKYAAQKVGFIGLGNMGAHMARNLLKKGYPVVVYDLNGDAVNSLKESGKVWSKDGNKYKIRTRLLSLIIISSLVWSHQYLIVSPDKVGDTLVLGLGR
jgi:UDP-N-acetylmuramoylalanine-D-glutamate ligase